MSDSTDTPESTDASKPEVLAKRPQLAELDPSKAGAGGKLSQLLSVNLEVEAVLGRKQLPIGEILKLGSGSVVEFDRTISEPVDVVVQGVTVARGEVVVVEDSFAIRIKEVISPQN